MVTEMTIYTYDVRQKHTGVRECVVPQMTVKDVDKWTFIPTTNCREHTVYTER